MFWPLTKLVILEDWSNINTFGLNDISILNLSLIITSMS